MKQYVPLIEGLSLPAESVSESRIEVAFEHDVQKKYYELRNYIQAKVDAHRVSEAQDYIAWMEEQSAENLLMNITGIDRIVYECCKGRVKRAQELMASSASQPAQA